MKRRIITAVATGALGVAGGVGVALWQNKEAHVLGIVLVTGIVGFLFGLVFELK